MRVDNGIVKGQSVATGQPDLVLGWSPCSLTLPNNVGCPEDEKTQIKGARADDRPGEAGPVTLLLRILQRLSIPQMTITSLHHLALPISLASCSILLMAFKSHTLAKFFILVAFAYTVPFIQRRQWHPTPVLLPGKSH